MKKKSTPTAAERALVEQIERTQQLVDEATAKERFDPAVRAQTHLSGLVLDLERRRAARLAEAEADPVRRLTLLRQLAEADGSWVAAERLRRQEDAARAAAPASGEEFDRLPLEEQVARIAADLRQWPDQFLELAIAELEQRHAGRLRYVRVVEGGQGNEEERGDDARPVLATGGDGGTGAGPRPVSAHRSRT